jgi:hypothetical protein
MITTGLNKNEIQKKKYANLRTPDIISLNSASVASLSLRKRMYTRSYTNVTTLNATSNLNNYLFILSVFTVTYMPRQHTVKDMKSGLRNIDKQVRTRYPHKVYWVNIYQGRFSYKPY